MATTNDYEDGLKMIEELTTNAEQIQEQVLQQILERNSRTEYLSRFMNGQTDKQCFKTNVPIVTYEDVKPYIGRIADGETSNILVTEPVVEFHTSTGTSGGLPKLMPVTAEIHDQTTLCFTLLRSLMIKQFGDLDKTGKRLALFFAKPDTETASGIKKRTVLTSILKDPGSRAAVFKLYTSPIEAVFSSDNKQSMFCQLLIGLTQRDDVVSVGSTFATVVLRAIKFLEDHYEELCSNIKTGRLSNWITDAGCRNVVSLILKPNPELADSIQCICNCKSWEGILKKLWPKAKLIDAIATGSMSQYAETLEFYGGGLPIVSTVYICSEAVCGINLEPLSKPFDVSYTFLPNMAYFEFLPVNKDGTTTSEQIPFNGEPVDLVNVRLGQYYELLVTTFAGLYRYKVGDILMVTGFRNNAPQFQFVERRNIILSVDTDKTSESDLIKAVTEAKTLLEPFGFILRSYTSYADTSAIPGHYVIFWELMEKEDVDNTKDLDPMIMVECCCKMEESLSLTYKIYRREDSIAALEIRVVKQGSFEALMDYYVSQGAALNQYKGSSCIKSKDAIKILDSRVIARFFSTKKPLY
ncbi:indole-3-acetic acid-amido synthetase GH3.17-like [Hibiscus syriacus]|uniref:indole-3-acetic acid-amido synthetase GH3.17-like n=1 Tax=Hibiscus syriacus TaxID=106335 RepID=UPI001921C561|nr:indole-3-acetic acid-amido synthetase GH3.17-like [Hibiscus syriacus]